MENQLIKKYIIITTIFNPTVAINSFSKKEDYQIIVVGDRKTPVNWKCRNVDYISVNEQELSKYKIAKILPYNHYCRKMFGYLKAIKEKADYIVDTDDDNIPKSDWCFPDFENKFDYISENRGFINVYQLYTNLKIWPRGLPLNSISTDFNLKKLIRKKQCKVGVWQGLADEDPDVDAIYRLTNNETCFFEDRKPIVLGFGTISPFNSQNTIFCKELFPLLYLPAYVTFRFTDILRSLIAQPIMWLNDYHLGFTNATVVQKRNPHDYMKDFVAEMPMYEHTEKVIELVLKTISKSKDIPCNLYNAYKALLNEGIVCKNELIALEAWLTDISKS